MLEQWSRPARMRAVLCLASVVSCLKADSEAAASTSSCSRARAVVSCGEEVLCVFGCDDCFDINCDFDPACDEGACWSVAGVDGPESSVNGEGRFVRGPVTALVEAAVERVPVFVIPWSAVFVMVVGHIEVNVVLFSEGALDLL